MRVMKKIKEEKKKRKKKKRRKKKKSGVVLSWSKCADNILKGVITQ